MPSPTIDEDVRNQVRERANYLCEYCHTSEKWQYVPFTIDHVIPVSKGGSDGVENLALACFHCNRRKSNRITAVDPQSDVEVPLFHPRQEKWQDHFVWSVDKLKIEALTPTGRATVQLLQLNRERILPIRMDDMRVNRHPPPDDPVLG